MYICMYVYMYAYIYIYIRYKEEQRLKEQLQSVQVLVRPLEAEVAELRLVVGDCRYITYTHT